MRQMIKFKMLIGLTILLSCEGKEQPILHDKTSPFVCDNKYFVKLLNTEIDKEHIVPSDDGKSFYTITENGILRYDLDGIQKRWEKSYYFGNIGNSFFVRPDKKIWITTFDEPGVVSGPFPNNSVLLIDTLGNVFLNKKANGGIIRGSANGGYILAYNEYDSAEWVNYSISKRTDKYYIESHDELGDLLWKKKFDIKGGEINSLCNLSTNEILVGGYVDSLDSHGGHGKAYLAKLSKTGILKWEKTYPPDNYMQLFSIKAILEKTPQSYNLVIGGEYSFHTVEIDSSGLTSWDSEFDGYFYRNEHLLYTNNRFIVLYNNQNDIIISCLNESGIVQWSHNYGGTGNESASSINVLSTSDLFITGSTQNWDGISYDPSFSDYFIRTDKDGNNCY